MEKIYTVQDSKAETCLKPMFLKSNGEAIRLFENEVNAAEKSTMLAKYPADYTLFAIGEYDERSGMITPYDAKINLGNGMDFINATPNAPLAALPNS